MTKNDRNHVEQLYVLRFIPCHQGPHLPEALDPFLTPLVQDIPKRFIDGFSIFNCPKETEAEEYQTNEEETVHVLLLCWRGDHPSPSC